MIPIEIEKQIDNSSFSNEILAEKLREKIIKYLEVQGFRIDQDVRPIGLEKNVIRNIHELKRTEQIFSHKEFLLNNLKLVKKFSIGSKDLDPAKIDLELIEVKSESIESRIFFWWNLVWWSLPFDKPIGRQMKFILWDKKHNVPFGLIGLQSPPLRSAVRDRFLGLSGSNGEYWINQSMYAQRVGALPPFNELLGGKMVALSLASNEIRNFYKKKYSNTITLMKKRTMPNNLLFITTSSAFGKSSMYDRIVYDKEKIGEFIGYTSGAGTFHVSEPIYRELLLLLQRNGKNAKLGYGTGSSRKLSLVSSAFHLLKIPKYQFHNIRRGYYFFSHIFNLMRVIHENEQPQWYDRPFNRLFEYWKLRWGLPRAERTMKWKTFDRDVFFDRARSRVEALSDPSQVHF